MRKIAPLDLVETVREGLLVLEPDLTSRFANRSFCPIFESRQRTGSGASSMNSATDSGTFPTSAPRSRLSFPAEQPLRPPKPTSFSRLGRRVMTGFK
jgi:hypothetical protein